MKSKERFRFGMNNAIYSFLFILPDLILIVGICLGWYTRWTFYGFTGLLLLLIVGLFIFFCALILHYYFSISRLDPVAYLWIGCMLGVVSLYDNTEFSNPSLEHVSSLLLLSSVVCQVLFDVLRKCCKREATDSRLFEAKQLFELLGLIIAFACGIAGAAWSYLLCLYFAFLTVLISLKLKSVLAIGVLLFLMVTSEVYVFPDAHISVNTYAIICVVARHSCPAILDIFLCSRTRLERWQSFIIARKFWQRLFLFAFTILELIFFSMHASAIGYHKEWYIVVPMFVVVAILWFLMHFVLIVIAETLLNRYAPRSDANTPLEVCVGVVQLKRLLAARGLRYFSLVAQRFLYVTVFSTLLVSVLCWTTRTPYNHPLLATVLSLELVFTELLHEFSVALGGTCIGYAVVAPVAAVRSDGLVSVLPPNFIQVASQRSTQIINNVMQFFTSFMITNFGCDWSMHGVEEEDFIKKLKLFFTQTTYEGPRYDTYLLYYSGPVNGNGDWALTNGSTLALNKVVQLWQEACDSTGSSGQSRLALICDSDYSYQWVKPVWQLAQPTLYLSLQTCRFHKGKSGSADLEQGSLVGQFTQWWVDFNVRALREPLPQHVKPYYGVSRRWTDFQCHMPSTTEIREYWLASLPRVTHTLLGVILFIVSARIPLTCCDCCIRLMKRWRMRTWPPSELDFGHGFKMVSG